jgi:diguanylate cyclase (GGDEF)-like protein
MSGSPIPEDTIIVVNDGTPLPPWLDAWLGTAAPAVLACADEESVVAFALRSRPRAVVLDGRCATADVFALCRRLKADSWTAIVPIVLLDATGDHPQAFDAGADEVLRLGTEADEAAARLGALLRRSDRDIDVHPSTRLPGTRAIEGELRRRLARQEPFAACYADLDHFKEFNDRYGFHQGNEVIRLVARVLHDVVKGLCGEEGFVGHIGGDDFLYIVPLAAMPRVCDEVIRVFDELAPLQYSEADRRAGYFMGKDRRNQLYRVPLMTLSVGVVTNQRRRFAQPSEVSELATEMKSYAKTLPGSLWTVDRRRDDEPGEASGRIPPVRPEPQSGAPVAGGSTPAAAAAGAPGQAVGGATVLPMRPRGTR